MAPARDLSFSWRKGIWQGNKRMTRHSGSGECFKLQRFKTNRKKHMKYLVAPRSFLTGVLCAIAIAAATGNPSRVSLATEAPAAQNAKVTPLMTKDLTGLAGKEATMLTVEYAPGASSGKHRHNAHTFVYVLEGSITMQVAGGKETTLGPGQTFYESPDDIHAVSKNASNSQPAKFLVFFVKDKGAPASTPVQ
jgi:quercetin dioxygenase-like cupin family protein